METTVDRDQSMQNGALAILSMAVRPLDPTLLEPRVLRNAQAQIRIKVRKWTPLAVSLFEKFCGTFGGTKQAIQLIKDLFSVSYR